MLTAIILLLFLLETGTAQEIYFFTEGTDNTFYDQGLVDKNNLGESYFEYTFPPGGPQWNDKVPCSTNSYNGQTSLKFNYTSAENGNWAVSIYRKGWTTADISSMDTLAFYIYAENNLPSYALPLIGVKAANINNSGDVASKLYHLSEYNKNISEGKWTKVVLPLSVLFNDSENAALNFTSAKGILFNQSENNNSSRIIYIDDIVAYRSLNEIPAVESLTAKGYDSHAELNWIKPLPDLTYRIYASFDGGQTYSLRTETTENYYLDFIPDSSRNSTVNYRIVSIYQGNESSANEKTAEIRDYNDEELLDMIQRYTFRYFWEGAHHSSGMALERSNGNGKTVASGAGGMGLMAMIVAHEREFYPRDEIKDRILNILEFLENCNRHHGAWSHWYNGDTYQTQPFSPDDDGGDIVETSYVAQGLIALKNYFSGSDAKSVQIRGKANLLWREVDWNWYRNGNQNVLFWHWSPNINFQKNMKVTGWNECLVTYIMAASSPTFGVPKEVYEQGWAQNGNMVNKRNYFNYEINLSPNWGGPLFWLHYSHLGINPHGLKDRYADYWQEHVNTAKIHYEYAVNNPLNHINYSDKNWGLTASDDPYGYTAHQPQTNDNGTISLTAALASMPYTPQESLMALKYFYRERGKDLFGKLGPFDAFNDNLNWVREAYLGIDQGPIVVMIENYRTGLLWQNVMKDADVQAGLEKLGFQYKVPTSARIIKQSSGFQIYPNPTSGKIHIIPAFQSKKLELKLFSVDGRLLKWSKNENVQNELILDFSEFQNGVYFIQITDGNFQYSDKLIIQK